MTETDSDNLFSQMLPRGGDIYVWAGESDAKPPKLIEYENQTYHRFMDEVYLPAPPDRLTTAQIQVLNCVRDELLNDPRFATVNSTVKTVFARIFQEIRPISVLEWGCGYRSMREHLPIDARYVGVDIDPSVIASQQRKGETCFFVSDVEDDPSILGGPFDLVFGVFVFLFHITDKNVSTMSRCISEDGLILFNMYLRDERSQADLIRTFQGHDLVVERTDDRAALCRKHEYWCAVRPHFRHKAVALLANL